MVNDDAELDLVFAALADRKRRAILARLAQGPASVGELAQPFDISLAAVSKHLKVLRNAGLVTREIDGRIHRCSLRPEPLEAASTWIATYQRFWSDRFDALAAFLHDARPKESDDG